MLAIRRTMRMCASSSPFQVGTGVTVASYLFQANQRIVPEKQLDYYTKNRHFDGFLTEGLQRSRRVLGTLEDERDGTIP